MRPSRPRVIFVNRVYWPSTEATAQLLTDLAEGLVSRGWDVHVVAAGEYNETRERVEVHRTFSPATHGNLLSRAWNYRRFLRAAPEEILIRTQSDTVVVALTDPPSLGAMVADTVAGKQLPVVQWIQDIYPEIAITHFGGPARFFLSGMKRRRDRAWQGATACVTLGTDMAGSLIAAGVGPDQINLIPNWAPRELDAPVSADAVDAQRRRWDAAGRFIIAYAGNLGRVHEFDTVLAAAERLRDHEGIVFCLVGHGARYDQVARVVRHRGLQNVRIRQPVPRAQLGTMLAAADAHLVTLQPGYAKLVYPSKLAGVLAAGRPVLFVGPPEGEIARLLQDGACGASFAPGDDEGLATTARAWAANPSLTARLGQAARQVHRSRFSYAMALDRWDALLRSCLGRK